MKLFLGVTDNSWFRYLSKINPEDVNFWQPGGKTSFKILERGAPFLFKLKSPINAIGGVGFFSSHTFLPLNVAWDTFGNRNGCDSIQEFSRIISNYRKDRNNSNPTIGCIVLTHPIFFKEEDWIETPKDWNRSIVQGKSYDMNSGTGASIWTRVELLLSKYIDDNPADEGKSQLILEPPTPHYGLSVLQKVRLGQGAFRVLITDAYSRKCSITGERTLPVLEAAHIKPYAQSGPHFISNGLLLRSDMHKLFDAGYLTITNDLKIEVSTRIKEEFENGREYYKYHGNDLLILPSRIQDYPDSNYINWHNEYVFKG